VKSTTQLRQAVEVGSISGFALAHPTREADEYYILACQTYSSAGGHFSGEPC